mgnify:FL=1
MEKKKAEGKRQTEKAKELVGTEKKINPRGRIFEGNVIEKFPKRIVIEFGRTIYVRKYERYAKSRTRIHARLPENMKDKINIGDLIKVQECRPLSKIIHFVVIEKIKDAKENTKVENIGEKK